MKYNIRHIRLNETLLVPLAEEDESGNYLVFWWEEIPLGDLYIKPFEKLSEELLYNKIITAITPSLNYYLSASSSQIGLWQSLLKSKSEQEWKNMMKSVFLPLKPISVSDKIPISVII